MAVQNSVHGWVRNLDDGRVEAVLEGNVDDVDRVAEWCRRGPANSFVHDMNIQEEVCTGEFSRFDVLY